MSDALFLILGSSFAEGVDLIGGKAKSAIVVSPSLPEFNLIQENKRKLAERRGSNGFEKAYLHPGLQKVNQALGRLVRAPGQSVKALLHCERFAEQSTRKYLDSAYTARNYIASDEELLAWLESDATHNGE